MQSSFQSRPSFRGKFPVSEALPAACLSECLDKNQWPPSFNTPLQSHPSAISGKMQGHQTEDVYTCRLRKK
ncbi:hypothetical protein CEXT_702441 [Caerostris extrusa]|uniref:Uncharacterized protein n=1 Tax=Caerostris extrusa TaxID=172846 RepID=A0AAV4TDI1_CAEEX|nr:hypothetical protein CEXT_702441 [Caerostris extrusa]